MWHKYECEKNVNPDVLPNSFANNNIIKFQHFQFARISIDRG